MTTHEGLTGPAAGPERRASATALTLTAALVLVPRLAIMATSQRWLRSDEALVGLMAKHVFSRGEAFWFLYGQNYGGGHALLAYLISPLVAVFGPAAWIVNGAPMVISLANTALLWRLVRGRMSAFAAVSATVLYALAPAVMYQSFLANGGDLAMLLGLLGLHAFLRLDVHGRRWGFVMGLACGMAWYAMDYAALYTVTCGALLLADRRAALRSRSIPWAVVGGLVGVSPLIVFNLTHDWAHARQLLAHPPGLPCLYARFVEGLADFVTRDGAAMFTTQLDDFAHPYPADAWAHFAVAVAAALFVALDARPRRSTGTVRPLAQIERLSLAACAIYLLLYGISKYSAPALRTPRYFIPFYPFVAILLAAALDRLRAGARQSARPAALLLLALLAGQSLFQDARMVLDQSHREHGVVTHGASVRTLARFLEDKGIRRVMTPYEIQMRLAAKTDELVIGSCFGLSPLPRYRPYDIGVLQEIASDATRFACVFRADFAFARLGPIQPPLTADRWEAMLRAEGISWRKASGVGEFVVYYGFSATPKLVREFTEAASTWGRR